MKKERIYGKWICGALLLFGAYAPVCAQTGHLAGVRVIDDEVKKHGREVRVSFVLDVAGMHVKRQESVRLYPVVVARRATKVWNFPRWCLTARCAIRYIVVQKR